MVLSVLGLALAGLAWVTVPILWGRRRRALARSSLGDAPLRLASPHASGRLTVSGRKSVLTLPPGPPVLLRVDLWLTADRLIIASQAGVLVDAPVQADGSPLRSARCTGPGRLVVEGETAGGAWRLDVATPDAEGWSRELAAMLPAGASATWRAPAEPTPGP